MAPDSVSWKTDPTGKPMGSQVTPMSWLGHVDFCLFEKVYLQQEAGPGAQEWSWNLALGCQLLALSVTTTETGQRHFEECLWGAQRESRSLITADGMTHSCSCGKVNVNSSWFYTTSSIKLHIPSKPIDEKFAEAIPYIVTICDSQEQGPRLFFHCLCLHSTKYWLWFLTGAQ